MANPTFTGFGRPSGYDQTQKKFTLAGLLGLSGNYTTTTGIPMDWTNTLNASGVRVIVPPTYDGSNGPGTSIPLLANITPIGGYPMYWDSVNKSIRIWNGTTELTTAALPAALTAAGIPCLFYFVRG